MNRRDFLDLLGAGGAALGGVTRGVTRGVMGGVTGGAGVGVASGLALGLAAPAAVATPAEVQQVIGQLTGSAIAKPGRVRLDLPPLVENGNSVSLTVAVDSPMTAAEHVVAIHVLAKMNPEPTVVSFRLGPRAGRASVTTRMRLADTQTVVALCELSDGSYWYGSADAVVTLAACVEPV